MSSATAFVFVMDVPIAERNGEDEPTCGFLFQMNQNCGKFVMADEVFNSVGMGFLVPEGAPYVHAFSFK